MHNVREETPLHRGNSPLSDAIQLAQRRDVRAFEFIYRLHSRRVYNLCLRKLKDPTEAEDLTPGPPPLWANGPQRGQSFTRVRSRLAVGIAAKSR